MLVLCVFLLLACLFDYKWRKIPNGLVAVIFAIGLVRSGMSGGWQVSVCNILGMASVVVCLYPLYKIGALGAGDVKLFGVCAGYFPGARIFYFLFYSLLVAAVFSLIKLLLNCNAKERLCYFVDYVLDVARSGCWKLYMENERESRKVGVCMAGPILCSVLLYWGGVY